jgi:hypothetical protein
MGTSDAKVDLPLTLHISEQTRQRLVQHAADSGSDLANYVSLLVEELSYSRRTLEEISGPIYQRFLESGMTDEELGEQLEREKHAARAARRAAQSS